MKRAVAAAMLCLLLSGCGRGGDSAASGGLLGRAAGLDESETLLVIDGREIPAWQYLYWLAADCQQLEARCEAAETPLDWAAPLPDGGTYGELVKADALADTALYATVQTWAETYGCTLTAEERAAAGTDVSLSDGGAGACPDGNRAGIRQTLCALSGAGQPVSAGRGGTGAFSARIRLSAGGADPDPLKRRQNGGAAAGSGTVRTAQRRGGSLCGVRCAAERDGRGRTGG